jgi:plasmid stabilization system protein ParE
VQWHEARAFCPQQTLAFGFLQIGSLNRRPHLSLEPWHRCCDTQRRQKLQESKMPRGDKSSYSNKQKRQAEHIEESYKKRGVSSKTAAGRAWATVNKETGGAKKKTAKKSSGRKSGAKKSAKKKAATKKSAAKKSSRAKK